MSGITPWLVCAALLVILASVVCVAIKALKSNKNEIKRLTAELEAQKRVSEELCQYAKEIAKINGDKDSVAQKIKEAKNDEEVLAVIAGLVSTNNNRVRDKAKG